MCGVGSRAAPCGRICSGGVTVGNGSHADDSGGCWNAGIVRTGGMCRRYCCGNNGVEIRRCEIFGGKLLPNVIGIAAGGDGVPPPGYGTVGLGGRDGIVSAAAVEGKACGGCCGGGCFTNCCSCDGDV